MGLSDGMGIQNQSQGRGQQSRRDIPGAAQTVNYGSNIYNFYFVNPGQYGLTFNATGISGVGQQQYYPAYPQQNNPAPSQQQPYHFGHAGSNQGTQPGSQYGQGGHGPSFGTNAASGYQSNPAAAFQPYVPPRNPSFQTSMAALR